MTLFAGAVIWFAAWWFWESRARPSLAAETAAQILVLGSGIPTCIGLALGVVGLLPGNRARLIALLGVVLNGCGLVFVLRNFLLVGL
jgi:hypothetical protein